MGILLLSLYFCVKCFVDRCLSFCPSVRSGDLVAQSLLYCEVFVDYCCACPYVLSGDAFVLFLVGILFLSSLLFCEVFCSPSVLSGDLVAHFVLPFLVGIFVTQSLLFCEVFCRSLFVPLSFRS